MQGRVQTPPREVLSPPISLTPPSSLFQGRGVPPTYVYTQRREPVPSGGSPSLLMAPWDNYKGFYDLNVPWQQAPDPIRQSPFYSAGNKVNPGGGIGGKAQMNIVSHLAIGSREAVDEQTYRIGKLLGYMVRPMFAGKQQPWRTRSNIQEAVPTTYGSQFQVYDTQSLAGPSTASGFVLPTSSNDDGYPY